MLRGTVPYIEINSTLHSDLNRNNLLPQIPCPMINSFIRVINVVSDIKTRPKRERNHFRTIG